MKLFKRIADWLIERSHKTPYFHIEDYMRRWWLIPYNRTGIAVRVHEILRSDEDRHLHDHPWWNITIVLRGTYAEVYAVGKNGKPLRKKDIPTWDGNVEIRTRKPGSVVFRRASMFHKLALPTSWPVLQFRNSRDYLQNIEKRTAEAQPTYSPCTTLFITGPKRKDEDEAHSCWGFLVEESDLVLKLLNERYYKMPADVYLGERYVAPESYSG